MRSAAIVFAAALAILVIASCDGRDDDFVRCDHVERRCRSVCDYWCDYWGCYPSCWDQCWEDCYADAPAPAPGPLGDGGVASSSDAAPTLPPVTSDGGPGVLCSPCNATADCAAGALCILRGGALDAGGGRGFCGHGCQVPGDCPSGFVCSQIGSSRQCIPTAGRCE